MTDTMRAESLCGVEKSFVSKDAGTGYRTANADVNKVAMKRCLTPGCHAMRWNRRSARCRAHTPEESRRVHRRAAKAARWAAYEAALVAFVTTFTARRGFAPTLREIGAQLLWPIGTVGERVRALEGRGVVAMERRGARTIRVIEHQQKTGT